ncbi:hypothetical protein [Polaromonas sp. JS666]|uniref:hypothetical protein n=1 Tax=Polaromonas sp. (strain JS666 / ATCC BAA-500) TaxID=296591 RepID=UPI00005316DC|nr:hypothetical protein [Polaromonas sp. JS666]ABE47265.1 hypothetical protein Bpro_5411 [Polaromonas sp. JS666]
MRPPAPMTRQWVTEKNSFPVRGLVMYRWPPHRWVCNVELLRISRDDIANKPAEEVAFEVALSALHRYMTGDPKRPFEGETTAVETISGRLVEVPDLAFALAPFLVKRVKTLLDDGGGAIDPRAISKAQAMHAFETTGSKKIAEDVKLWSGPRGAERVEQIQAHEKAASKTKIRAMAARRKALARFWQKNKTGFYRRGLTFTNDQAGFWTFNLDIGNEPIDPVPVDSKEPGHLEALAQAVSRVAVATFAAAKNTDKGEKRMLRGDPATVVLPVELSTEAYLAASGRLAKRLLKSMQQHAHGVIGLGVIERCLTVAWDPEDNKPLEDYPFPLAPTETPQELDRWAMDTIQAKQARYRQEGGQQRDPRQAEAGAQPPAGGGSSWRQELEIEDWIPLEDAYEDDATIDQRAMAVADHQQSAALRRDRDGGGTQRKDVIPVQHKVDYAGLPKDDA